MKRYAVTLLAAAGLLAGCNESVKTASQQFNELPPAVQKTVRAQSPNGDIVDISQKSENGTNAYQVEFKGQGNNSNPKVLVAADGTLLSSDLGQSAGVVQKLLTPTGAVGTQYSALPEAVQHTIQSRAPNAPIASITRHDSNGRTIYEVEFKDQGKNPTIKVADDGTLVQDLQK